MTTSRLAVFAAALMVPALSLAQLPPLQLPTLDVNVKNTPLPVTVNGTATVAGTVSIASLPAVQIANQPSVTSNERSKWAFSVAMTDVGGGFGASIVSTRPGVIEFVHVMCEAAVYTPSSLLTVTDGSGCSQATRLPPDMSLAAGGAGAPLFCNAYFQVTGFQLVSSPEGIERYVSSAALVAPFTRTITISTRGTALGGVLPTNGCGVTLVGHYTD